MKDLKKTALLILDGWGIGADPKRSAIAEAATPYYDSMIENEPNATLLTHGKFVGLPDGQMGNSEVGHMNIGAGRIVYQDLALINKDMESGEFQGKEIWQNFKNTAKESNKVIHLIGLVSDGGVHSHIDHLKKIIEDISGEAGLRVFIHAFLDGRDTDPQGGRDYLAQILEVAKGTNCQLASVIGRYYAMDRDKRWERTKKAYDLLTKGEGEYSSDILSKIKKKYKEDITDEFMDPIWLSANKDGIINEGDSVFFFNFRTDRPRQLTQVLTQKSFPDYDMETLPLDFLTMTKYDESYTGIREIYSKEVLASTLGSVIAENKLTQLRIAETEKYPHVTFFFSAGREEPEDGEHRIMVASPKVATYDMQPEMSANEITDKLLNFINKEVSVDFICLNFANTDMVGHTGVLDAAIKAAETVDECVKRIVESIKEEYNVIIIADHGNSDYMINDDGSPNTAHTTNPVPVIILSEKVRSVKDGILADVAPTILHLMELDIPREMTGKILV